jgi:hypothetical protein
MNVKNAKSGCLRWAVLLAVLVIGGLCLGFFLCGDYAVASHKVEADKHTLEGIYSTLSKYRETYGRWPASIEEAVDQVGRLGLVSSADGVFHRPWLYYPDAKPGTKEVLAAVPDVIRMKWLPFIGWQDAVLADGTYVDFRSL